MKLDVLSILGFALLLGALPLFAGRIITYGCGDRGILFDYLSGLFFMMAVFQAVTLPCIYFDTSLVCDIAIWMAAMAGILVVFLARNRCAGMKQTHDGGRPETKGGRGDGSAARTAHTAKRDPVFYTVTVLAVLFIVYQTYMAVRYAHYDEDDAYYVAMATTSWSTNSLMRFNPYTGTLMNGFYSRYVLSPYSLFIAAIAKITDCHAAIVAHTFFPACSIPASYFVYTLIARKIFPKNRTNQAKLVLIIAVMGIFSLWSRRNQLFFLISKTWQGKAVLAGLLLPALFYLMLKHWQGEFSGRDWAVCVFLEASITLVSSMGIILGVIAVMIYAIVLAVFRHDLRSGVKMVLTAWPNIVLGVLYVLVF